MDKVKVRLSDLYNAEASGKVPKGYVEDCLSKATKVEDGVVLFDVSVYNSLSLKYRKPKPTVKMTARLP